MGVRFSEGFSTRWFISTLKLDVPKGSGKFGVAKIGRGLKIVSVAKTR